MDRPRRPAQLSRAAGSNGGAAATGDAGAAGVILGRRRGLSAPRAVLGGLLVAAAAVVVFAAALSAAGGHRTAYVVAARPLTAGSVIGPGDTTTARLGLSGATAAGAFRQGGLLIGRTLTVPIQAGELIESSMLGSPSGRRLRPVSVPVDTDSLAALSDGQAVDVLSVPSSSSAPAANPGASASGGSTSPAVTVVMRGATLLSAARQNGGLLSGSAGNTTVVTLGVTDLAEVEQVVQAAHTGTVELVQAQPADGTGLGAGG